MRWSRPACGQRVNGTSGRGSGNRWAKTLRLVWHLESGDWELLIQLVGTRRRAELIWRDRGWVRWWAGACNRGLSGSCSRLCGCRFLGAVAIRDSAAALAGSFVGGDGSPAGGVAGSGRNPVEQRGWLEVGRMHDPGIARGWFAGTGDPVPTLGQLGGSGCGRSSGPTGGATDRIRAAPFAGLAGSESGGLVGGGGLGTDGRWAVARLEGGAGWDHVAGVAEGAPTATGADRAGVDDGSRVAALGWGERTGGDGVEGGSRCLPGRVGTRLAHAAVDAVPIEARAPRESGFGCRGRLGHRLVLAVESLSATARRSLAPPL